MNLYLWINEYNSLYVSFLQKKKILLFNLLKFLEVFGAWLQQNFEAWKKDSNEVFLNFLEAEFLHSFDA